MANVGFFEQKSASPTRFALVATGHAIVLGAVLLAAGPAFLPPAKQRTTVFTVPVPQPPPQVERQRPREERPQPVPQIAAPPQQIELPQRTQLGVTASETRPAEAQMTSAVSVPPRDPPPVPVRIDAQVDPRFASALQPQYPAAEQRAGRTGSVVIRVTIGTDGRVRAAQRVSATSDLFWAAAERQALTRWRFRPATVDGRPVESSRTMTIHFRIEDV
ncbi:MAG: energy transducer TonB [Sphingomonas sp.]